MGANAIAGILTAGAGAASLGSESPVEDPRFDDFSKLEKSLGDMKLIVADAISNYFDQLLVQTPPNGDWGLSTELARALESGVFAYQDFGTGENSVNLRVMVRLIQASIISEAWNSGQVAIVKRSKDGHMAQVADFNPCFGDKKRYGMDHGVACQFDQNYMIVGFPTGVVLYGVANWRYSFASSQTMWIIMNKNLWKEYPILVRKKTRLSSLASSRYGHWRC